MTKRERDRAREKVRRLAEGMTPTMLRKMGTLIEKDSCILCGSGGCRPLLWEPSPEMQRRLWASPGKLLLYGIVACPTCLELPNAADRFIDALVDEFDEGSVGICLN